MKTSVNDLLRPEDRARLDAWREQRRESARVAIERIVRRRG